MRTFLTLAAVVGLSLPAQAGVVTGSVSALHVDADHVILSVAGSVTSKASCNVSNGFAADAQAALGQAVGQTVAAVEGSEFKVTATGAGTCNLVPGYEDLVSIRVSATPSP